MTLAGPAVNETHSEALRRYAHELIAAGYARMDASEFATKDEPTITGELVKEMMAVLQAPTNAPEWVTRCDIHDDPPQNVKGRTGKARPRVDIEFRLVDRGPRPRLPFEAKRLNRSTNHRVADYLGPNGMGRFLSGRYPLTHSEAGMLGYVQSEQEITWADRIAQELLNNRERYAVEPPEFAEQEVCEDLPHTHASHHRHEAGAPIVRINHVLLNFGSN